MLDGEETVNEYQRGRGKHGMIEKMESELVK